jgi:leader peptidase (prepilin peptidase)/N-methyltransferase
MITVIDLEWRLILHLTSLFGLLLGVLIGTALHGFSLTLAGGATGFLMMLVLYFSGFLFLRISRKFRGESLNETEALGFGDVNLGGVIGLLLGWPGIFLGLILAIMLAGIISLLYILYKIIRHQYHPNIALPYGPFLATSAVILLYLRNYLF